jgi:hypothetical protein
MRATSAEIRRFCNNSPSHRRHHRTKGSHPRRMGDICSIFTWGRPVSNVDSIYCVQGSAGNWWSRDVFNDHGREPSDHSTEKMAADEHRCWNCVGNFICFWLVNNHLQALCSPYRSRPRWSYNPTFNVALDLPVQCSGSSIWYRATDSTLAKPSESD